MDRAAEMTAFVRSVDGGGFSAAARELGLTPSALSKLVTRLEDRLGARLLQRTTRRLQLTPEGEAFCRACREKDPSYEAIPRRVLRAQRALRAGGAGPRGGRPGGREGGGGESETGVQGGRNGRWRGPQALAGAPKNPRKYPKKRPTESGWPFWVGGGWLTSAKLAHKTGKHS